MNRMPDHHHPLDSSSSRPLHLRGSSITNINSANIIDKIIRDRRRLEDEDVNYWRKRAGWADDDETMKQYNEGASFSGSGGEQTTQTVTNQAKDQAKDIWSLLGLISSVIFIAMLARCCTSVLCGSKKHKSKSVDSSGSRSVRGEKNGERRSRSRSRTRSKSRSRSKKRSSRGEKKKSSSKSNKEGGDSDTSSDYKLMDDADNNDDNKSSKSSRSRSRSRITGRSRSKSKTRSSKSKTPRLSIGGESTSGDEKSSVKSSGSGKKKKEKKSSGDDMDKKKMLV